MARGRQKQAGVEVVALSLTLDEGHAGYLDRVVRTGVYGRNRSDAASQILRLWLRSNLKRIEDEDRELAEGADESA